MSTPGINEDKLVAAVDLLGRTGVREVQIRYCEEEAPPIVWIASGRWQNQWEATAGISPWRALFRLCEAVMDGGTCTHCRKMTAVDDKPPDVDLLSMDDLVCFYRYDPELKTFRRSCEGVVA